MNVAWGDDGLLIEGDRHELVGLAHDLLAAAITGEVTGSLLTDDGLTPVVVRREGDE